ncbi:putative uncharacterized protein [Burkholderiales bacterium GJ-E10]|nr:putative uncharacterized protein [Burkholderiales bacterium GJ-E10]
MGDCDFGNNASLGYTRAEPLVVIRETGDIRFASQECSVSGMDELTPGEIQEVERGLDVVDKCVIGAPIEWTGSSFT